MRIIIIILLVIAGLGYFFKDDMLRQVQKVDAQSPKALKVSIQEISKGLSEDEKKVFANGIAKLAGEGTTLSTLLSMTNEDEILWKTLTNNIHGKSVSQVLAKGKN